MYASKPKWWMLYATIPLTLTALLIVGELALPGWVKTVVAVATVISAFVGMGLWMNANEGTILRAELQNERRLQAGLHRKAYAWRSRSIPVSAPLPDSFPVSGFGSARFKPARTYEYNKLAPQHVRLIARVDMSRQKAF